MRVETREVGNGTEITVYTDKKVAIAVKEGQEERIYLPGSGGESSTYYAGSTTDLTQISGGYQVVHRGSVDDVKVIG